MDPPPSEGVVAGAERPLSVKYFCRGYIQLSYSCAIKQIIVHCFLCSYDLKLVFVFVGTLIKFCVQLLKKGYYPFSLPGSALGGGLHNYAPWFRIVMRTA